MPAVGAKAPDFKLTSGALAEVSLKDFAGKRKIFNIYPSIDTPTCATSTRKFNEAAGKLANTVVLCVSGDLPFAAKRFCDMEGLANVSHLSTFRNPELHESMGSRFRRRPAGRPYGACRGRARRGRQGDSREMVPEIGQEPNYDAALKALG